VKSYNFLKVIKGIEEEILKERFNQKSLEGGEFQGKKKASL